MRTLFAKVTAISLLTFAVFFVTGCHKEENDNELKSITRHGTIDAGQVSTSSLTVISMSGETDLSGSSFDIDVPQEADLNLLLVTNEAGDPIMLYRERSGQTVAINSQTTAMALVTMYPLFASANLDDYEQLETYVMQQESFNSLVIEVERSISQKRSVYDTTNAALFESLTQVLDDVVQAMSDGSKAAGSKNVIFGQNCDPLVVRNDWLDVLTFREVGLWPSYFGTATTPSGKTKELSVFTRDDLGIMDLITDASIYGEATEYQASEVGIHTITLSCNNAKGRSDFYLRIASEFLAVVGFSLESGGQGWANNVIGTVADMMESGMEPNAFDRAPSAILSLLWNTFIDYMKEKPTGVLSKFAKVLSPMATAYSFVKASFNGFPRVRYFIGAPSTITLTFERKPNGELGTAGGSAGDDWVDLGLPSGLLWATRNVGASSPEDYGAYFAWGETSSKSVYDWATYRWCYNGMSYQLTKYCTDYFYGYNSFTDGLTTLQPDDDAATVNYGGRTPTIDEWGELISNTTGQCVMQNGVNGVLLMGSNGSSLFLPAAGYRLDSSLVREGLYGHYWSSSIYGFYPVCACCFDFNSNGPNLYNHADRNYGRTIRAVRQN